MAAIKPEEISHSPMDQLQGLEYCIDSNPSWGMYACMFSFNLFSLNFTNNVNVFFFFLNLVFNVNDICLCFELLTVETIALGFQHYILALGTAVMIPTFLVPSMGGSDVSHS
jgi:nucleobase transporter 1/2